MAPLALLAWLVELPPATAGCEIRKQTARAVVAVLDGDTIKLDDGREVNLLGVLAPTPPPGLAADAGWAPNKRAHEALSGLVAGKSVRLGAAGRQKDRYGRAMAHVFLAAGKTEVWIEEQLIEQGHARVMSSADNRSCIADLLAAEARARRAGRGLWEHAAYQVRDAAKAHEIADFVQSYQIVEGRVREVQERKRRVYLDFGANWSTDLTAIVSGRDRKRFDTAGVDLLMLKGRKVRLRGWVERWNGPLIRLTHPEQIEVLEPVKEAPPMTAVPATPIAIGPGARSE